MNKLEKQVLQKQSEGKEEKLAKKLQQIDRLTGCKYEMVDAHVHVVDFNQQTPGLKQLLHYMDQSNVKAAVISGLSVAKIWQGNEATRPAYYLDDDNPCYFYGQTDAIVAREYMSLTKKEQERFFPLLCGFNPNDINSVEHIIQTYHAYPGVFCGIGEVFYRHDDLTHMIYGEVARMNTTAAQKLFAFASEYDLPIMVHSNVSAPGISSYPKFLHELESVVREFPKTRMVWAHAGASRRLNAPYYTKMIARLMEEYPGIYIDLAWVVFDDIVAINENSLSDWVELCETFSDRVMIGSDVLGNAFEEIGILNARFNIFLDRLTPETRQKICVDNALQVYAQSKNRFEKGLKRDYPTLDSLMKK